MCCILCLNLLSYFAVIVSTFFGVVHVYFVFRVQQRRRFPFMVYFHHYDYCVSFVYSSSGSPLFGHEDMQNLLIISLLSTIMGGD